ncbi:MAG: nuclear transport factor 2 family protein [Chitinophagaceae bacterium]
MKKIFLFFLAAGSLVFLSCNNEGGMSAAAKKNKETNDAIMKAYEAGDFSKMGDYIAADAVDHGGETGDIKGLENIVNEMKRYHAMMPDMKATTSRSLADDEYVFTWATMTGTMNGKAVTMSSVDVSKFKDGKAVEHWVYMDPKEMMQMMPPAPAPVTDTLKK